MKYSRVVFLLFIFIQHIGYSQNVGTYLGDERALYAETKQVNQFFRRFNSEEDLTGKRIYEGSEHYHDKEFRSNYIKMLFDKSNKDITEALKNEFISDVTDQNHPVFLDFYGGKWFAEVESVFLYDGTPETVVLFLDLEKDRKGIKWVITNVYFYPFAKLFYTDSTAQKKFLHPMSHELDFMNLIKVFQDKETVEYYFDDQFQPDFRTLFLYEVKKGDLVYQTIKHVRFHFFQAKDWYFELSEFNRSGYNTGWLISNLTRIPEDQKALLLKYIYYEK